MSNMFYEIRMVSPLCFPECNAFDVLKHYSPLIEKAFKQFFPKYDYTYSDAILLAYATNLSAATDTKCNYLADSYVYLQTFVRHHGGVPYRSLSLIGDEIYTALENYAENKQFDLTPFIVAGDVIEGHHMWCINDAALVKKTAIRIYNIVVDVAKHHKCFLV